MKRSLVVVLIAALAAIFASTAFAGTARQERREVRQGMRIAQGVRSGSLTRAETARLLRGQARVDRLQARARADDGRIGPRERARIERAQDRQSRVIHRLKHNGRGSI